MFSQDYHKIIKKPMDLGTIDKKLREGKFSKEKIDTEFYKEVTLVFDNAIKYNPNDNEIHKLALELKKHFDDTWASNKAALPLNCALRSNAAKTPAAKAKSAAAAKAAASAARVEARGEARAASSGAVAAATPSRSCPPASERV